MTLYKLGLSKLTLGWKQYQAAEEARFGKNWHNYFGKQFCRNCDQLNQYTPNIGSK